MHSTLPFILDPICRRSGGRDRSSSAAEAACTVTPMSLGTVQMLSDTAEEVLWLTEASRVQTVGITGGVPELNARLSHNVIDHCDDCTAAQQSSCGGTLT